MDGISFVRPLFGGEIEIIVYGEDKLARHVFDEVYNEALRLQKIFNFFDEESELSMLNKERKLKVSLELLEVLVKALHMSKLTSGKYDISLGKQILERKKGLNIQGIEGSYKDIILDIRTRMVVLNSDVVVDLGSIAKGYITDKIGNFLKNKGIQEFFIDSRGDILVSGKMSHVIPIKHPRKDEDFCTVKLNNLSIATSGDYNQYSGNYKNSHILNSKDLISVSVVAPTLEEADLYSTSLFVCDKNERERLMDGNKGVKALVIKEDLSDEKYNGFEVLINE